MATTRKKTASKSRGRSAPARKKSSPPIRREVSGIVFLLLALCVLVSWFTADGWLIELFPKVLKGLLGWGFYLVVPALGAASWILLTHKGRPVVLRTACVLLTPYLAGGILHMLFCKVDLTEPERLFSLLWETGGTMESGGALSGATAHGFMAVLGRSASVMVFLVLLAVLLMVAFEVTPAMLLQMWRDRERREYDEDDYEEEEVRPVKQPRPAPKKKRPAQSKTQARASAIDIPLDGEDGAWEAGEKKAGYFRPKEQNQMTPADLASMTRYPEEAAPPEWASGPSAYVEEEPVSPPEPVVPDPVPEPDSFEPEPEPETEPEEPVPEPREEEAVMVSEVVVEDPTPPPFERTVTIPAAKGKKKAGSVEEASAQVAAEIERGLSREGSDYDYPPLSLLAENAQDNYIEAGAELRVNARRLADTLRSFGVDAEPGEVIRGPAITRYEFILKQGVKLSKVTNLADDIALALGASGVRIAPIPDKISVVGIEVPNKTVSPVFIRDVIESRTFLDHRSSVAFAVGRDIGNNNIVGDISKLPHVLIAGTTGSGKSVCTNSLIISLLYKSSPEDVRFIMVDPKMVELAPYNGIPHLLIPVVTDPKKAAGALQWAVYEMMKRYKTFSELGVKKLEEYNALAQRQEGLPHMASVVVVIDELADLMVVAAKEVEESICRVAQMGRAAGMHLVIATQRPSSDVITGLMKANIPSRIAFAVDSAINSRIILDNAGAEKLVGRGDMLYAPLGIGKPIRVQGCYITPEEIDRVVGHVKSTGEAQYSDEVMQKIEESVQEKEKKGAAAVPDDGPDEGDELLPAAVEVILETGQASVSMLQRRLKLGYSRAARLVDQMEERGIVGPFEGSKPRQLLITKAQWQEMQMGGRVSEAEKDAEIELDDVPWVEEDE